MMIQGKWFPQGSDLSEALSVRRAVFGRDQDVLDSEAQNVVVYQDDLPVASGRLWWEDGAFWLGDIGVLPAYRGTKLGDLTLRLLLFKAQNHFAREVRLRCPEDIQGFFARLGLREVSRKNGLLEMMVPGDEIDLDSCKSCKKADCPNRKD